VSVVADATNTHNDGVESNGRSLKNGTEICVLFLCGLKLVRGLMSSQ
jgi:hypothetical protein